MNLIFSVRRATMPPGNGGCVHGTVADDEVRSNIHVRWRTSTVEQNDFTSNFRSVIPRSSHRWTGLSIVHFGVCLLLYDFLPDCVQRPDVFARDRH